ncbi:DUF2971 domain-containing protein [Ensifer canadensis]
MAYYHYCSTETFRNIVSNRTIWLSSLTPSNDSLEGKWLGHVLEALCRQANLAEWETKELVAMSQLLESLVDCLGFCMSTVGDTLSQWRGYADDGRGMSIGFSAEFIEHFKVKSASGKIVLQKVVYSHEEQVERLSQPFAQALEMIRDGALRRPLRGSMLVPKSDEEYEKEHQEYAARNSKLFGVLTSILNDYFALKNPAFVEEREWRLVSTELRPQLSDCEFRVRDGQLIPYIALKFPDIVNPITEVYLGPKNPTSTDIVEAFLKGKGTSDVAVKRSSASYR